MAFPWESNKFTDTVVGATRRTGASTLGCDEMSKKSNARIERT